MTLNQRVRGAAHHMFIGRALEIGLLTRSSGLRVLRPSGYGLRSGRCRVDLTGENGTRRALGVVTAVEDQVGW